MTKLLLLAIVLLSASVVTGQTPSTSDCKMTFARAPEIRGLRLGMTIDQALAVFPGSQADSALQARLAKDNFGEQYTSVDPAKYDSKEKFIDVNGITLSFLDARLFYFSIWYKGPEWKSDEQFAARVAEALNLPGVGSWKHAPNVLQLACDGFLLSVMSTGSNTIALQDVRMDVAKIVNDRAEIPKEKARRAFKP